MKNDRIRTAWFETTNMMFSNPTICSAFYGLTKLWGLEHRFFESTYLPDNNIRGIDLQENIFVGSVELIRRVLELNGYESPPDIDYPAELKKYLGRELKLVSLSQFQENWESFRGKFIKPFKHKLFDGFIFEKMHQLLYLNRLRSSDQIWISEPLNIISEYRVYVSEKQVKSFSHYKGLATELPDMSLVTQMIKDYRSSPISYALDVGVVYPSNKTILIEVNDSFALGQYCFIPHIQSHMLLTRWEELTHESNKRDDQRRATSALGSSPREYRRT